MKTAAAVTAAHLLAGALAAVLAGTGGYLFSGFLFILLAGAEYLFYYRRERKLLQMEAVFSLFWNGGIGLSAMKLSRLAEEWEPVTWLCLILVYPAFLVG